jgi:hypothetical protein
VFSGGRCPTPLASLPHGELAALVVHIKNVRGQPSVAR